MELRILLQCFDFKKLILPRINMKEADFQVISHKFKSISELDLDLLNQSSLLVDVELPKTLRTIILRHFNRRSSQNVLKNLPSTL